jgi:hypothetical protein
MWPFKYINGLQTPESVALEAMPEPPKQSLYEIVINDPETQEALL